MDREETRRLERVEAYVAILELLSRYAHALDLHGSDAALEAEWVDCFVDDAVWIINGGPRAGRHRGRDELQRFIASHRNDPPVYQHLVSCPRVRVDGQTARAESYLTRIEDHPVTGPRLDAFGLYRDDIVRCPDGEWRFSRRIIDVRSGGAG